MKIKRVIASLALLLVSIVMPIVMTQPVSAANGIEENGSCSPKGSVLGLPTWYKYLPGKIENVEINGTPTEQCTPQIRCVKDTPNCHDASTVDASKIWLIGLAVLEALLRLAGLIAVFMVVYGGVKYVISQGQPDATKGARQTIINALIGIVISILAVASVNFGAKFLQ